MAKMLIADENKENRALLLMTAKALGFESVTVPGGTLAKEILRHNSDFDLAVISMSLPDIDGKTLVRAVRHELGLDHMPIVISSGRVSIHDIDELLSLGASYFLSKPIKEEELKDYIMKIIRKYSI